MCNLASLPPGGVAVLVAARDGMVVAQNNASKTILGKGAGKACWNVVGALSAPDLPCGRGCTGELLASGIEAAERREIDVSGISWELTCVPNDGFVVVLLTRHTGGKPGKNLGQISAREFDVLHLLVKGATTGTIAATLDISRSTVRTHVEHMLSKLGVRTRAALVAECFRLGYLE